MVKHLPVMRETRVQSPGWEDPLEKAMASHLIFFPGEFYGQKGLLSYGLWDCRESDMTEWLHFHFSLSCIGEGNGNPLQCSCLENPRDGGAWWAAIYGVAQSWTRLKWLSSSSSIEVKDLYTLTIKHWKKLKKTWINGRTAHVNGLEDLNCWDRSIAQSYLKI